MEVCAFSTDLELFGEEESEYEHAFGCATTAANGEYTISGLGPESYLVGFEAPVGSSLDYVRQFYDGKLRFSEASAVIVTAEKTTTGIDAELALGGEIAGTLTDGETGAPIAGGFVCAAEATAQSTGELGGCAGTEADGAYTVRGLATGAYNVLFAASGFEVQFYNDKSSLGEAELVSVLAPELTPGIDARLKVLPLGTGPGSGASSSTSGTTIPSGGLSPSKSPAASTVSLVDKRLMVGADGRALVRVACTGAAGCRAKLTLKLERTIKKNGKKLRRTLAVGKTKVLEIAAGHTLIAGLELDADARRLLRAGDGRLEAELELAAIGGKHEEGVVLVAHASGKANP